MNPYPKPGLFFLTGLFAVLASTSSSSNEARIWTSSNGGRQFQGTFIKVEGESISIRRDSDKAVFQVKKADLISEDWDWIVENTFKTPELEPVEDLSELVAGVPVKIGTPSIGVLLVEDGKVRGLGVAGVRVAASEATVAIDDKWHIGSCTKSMTATLAATFVEEEAVSWQSTLGEILGEKIEMKPEYELITLGMLLANRSGITGKPPQSVYDGIDIDPLSTELSDRKLLKQRATYVESVLNLEPSSSPNTQYEYSNAGFVVAASMLEEISGKPWEKLMQERIFEPLGMKNTGFGNAARKDSGKPTQPWPHTNGATPYEPGPWDDNPWALGPAGSVHGSLRDMARYLAMHATREIGPVIKHEETYEFLHTAVPENNNYARGWIVTRTAWSDGPAISHDGSNTMDHCSFRVAPGRGAAVAAFTNCGENGREACMEAIGLVVAEFLE